MKEMTRTALHDAVASANEEFAARFNDGDAAGMAELYTEDGQVLPPNGDVVNGRSDIQAFWQMLMDMGIKGVELRTVDLEGGPDMAFEVSNFTLFDASGKMLDQGKYIVIWKHEDGDWLLHRDIFNSSMPVSAN